MATKTKPVTFESRFHAYALVRRPKVDIPSPTGIGYQNVAKGLTYQFQPVPSPKAESGFVGVLTVRPGQDKLDTDHDGWLRDDEDQGETRDAVQALMAHKEFGRDFWLQGHTPGTLYPRPEDWRKDVVLATANLNDDRLLEMIAEEKASHGRAPLIQEAQDALEVVTDIIAAEQAKQADAEAAKTPKPAPKAPAA